MNHAVPMAAFALLDDSADPAHGARLYTGLVREVTCAGPASLAASLQEIEVATRNGLHAVLLADYEFGVRLSGVATVHTEAAPGALRGLLFARMIRLDAAGTQAWLAAQDGASEDSDAVPGVAGTAHLRADITQDAFAEAISRIHGWLADGECYQINYTYRLHFDAFGSPVALYRRLRARQPVPFGALIVLPDVEAPAQPGRAILSLSPELFVRHHDGKLMAKPMKGTAPASGDAVIDAERSGALAVDEKNRAENLMIVDLLRNDLGRLATPGSVRVPALFEVTRFASVLQMTSTVTADLPPGVGFDAVLRALFPCGSITGAPKHRTMQLIGELEAAPRNLYTGAIGWLDAPRDGAAGLGDFCLSVAIRTLELDPPRGDGLRPGRLGVGAGIVLDSRAEDEWDECRLKAQFLTALEPGFQLIETMAATRGEGIRHLDRHLQRLSASAAYFGFRCDPVMLRDALAALCAQLPDERQHRVRLALAHDGTPALTHGALAPLTSVAVLLADSTQATLADDLFLRHKTTVRARYDAAWQAAEAQGAFDTLFFNERGELTEGGRSNVFVKRNGRWVTPPLSTGVLPGVMRAVLLEDPAWDAAEAVITRDDLLAADDIVVCNALRGALPARIVGG